LGERGGWMCVGVQRQPPPVNPLDRGGPRRKTRRNRVAVTRKSDNLHYVICSIMHKRVLSIG
jgi:hypothetical protein